MIKQEKDTRVHLVQELRRIMDLEENTLHVPQLKFMVAEAKAGEYHDFKNNKYDCGKVASYTYLKNINTPSARALADRIRDGEFDESPDADDEREMMSWLIEPT